MEYLTFLKIIHLIGLMFGLGAALYADYLMVRRGVLRPLEKQTLQQIEQMARFVVIGLSLLWASGALLAMEIFANNPKFFDNEKFWAKVSIVGALTVNGLIVHFFVLEEAQKSVGRRLLIDSSPKMVAILAAAGSVSFASWTIPFILGAAPEFSYVVPFETILAIWALCVFTSALGVMISVAAFRFWEYGWQEFQAIRRSQQVILQRLQDMTLEDEAEEASLEALRKRLERFAPETSDVASSDLAMDSKVTAA